MQLATTLFTSILGGGGTAAAGATATGAVTTAATGGLTLAKVLSGAATVGSMIASISAGNQDAEAATLAAADAEAQKPLETLQGISRRTSIKHELLQRIGEQDTAYAASGTDLSFGTPSVARHEAFRSADTALTSDTGTQQTRQARLDERAKNYRLRADRARSSGFLDAFVTGDSGFAKIAGI